MRKIVVIIALMAFGSSACNEKKIRFEEVIGTYEYTYHDEDPKWNLVKHIVTINLDTTYFHKMYHADTLLVDEHGRGEFHGFNHTSMFLYDFTAYNKYLYEIPSIRERFMFMVHRNIFGSVYLTFNWPIDPDGEPSKPRYKKVK